MMSASCIAVALAVVVGYVVTGKLGLHFAFLHASATPIWPPAGIALDVSRVMAGKISLDRRPLDLSEVVGRALAALAGHERLPVTAARAPAGASDATAPSPRRRRVLIVEDNDDAREMLRDLLRRLGHEVYETVDGIGGVEKALELRPDLTLVDVGLPGIDGYAVARRLRDDATGRRLRLVALTGYGLPEDRERALAAGFDAHVVKPIDLEKLRTILAEA